MFFWKKNNLTINKKVINYHIPISLDNSWFFLSKAYYTSVRLNLVKIFHQNIFSNIHYKDEYPREISSIKKYFIRNKVNSFIFDKTMNSFLISKDIKNSNAIKEDISISETPLLILYVKEKFFVITLPQDPLPTPYCYLIDQLDNIVNS
jgi:hypothetical protein